MIQFVLISLTLAWLISWWLSRYRGRFALLDNPNERSLHEAPVPRSGGIGVLIAIVMTSLVLSVYSEFSVNWWWLAAALPILVISLADDVRHVVPWLRLAFHTAAAISLLALDIQLDRILFAGIEVGLGSVWSTLVTVLFVVWMVNLYNFMDGMDGFAGGMAVFGFGCFAVLGVLAGDTEIAVFSGTIAAAAGGFLILNFPPAKIFLGDAGAGVLGFFAAMIILLGAQRQVLSFAAGVLVFSPFIVDATITVIRRALAGEAVWRAHRSHFYQKLVRSGFSHRRCVLSEYVLMLAAAISAILLFYNNNPGFELGLFVFWALLYATLAVWVSLKSSA